MDIAAASTAISQSRVQSQVATAVARKSLDAQQQQGDAAIELLRAAASVQEAARGRGASPAGVGAAVDVRA